MTYARTTRPKPTDCSDCPLRQCDAFKEFNAETLKFMQRFKVGELKVDAKTPLLLEGANSPQLYTALHGMGLRYKTLENGNRQVVNFIFPGDFIGLQASVLGEMKHSVEATSPMTLCVFDRKEIWQVFKSEPERAFDLTWLAAIEEHFLGEALATVGQRTAQERVAWALLRVFRRLRFLKLGGGRAVPFPYRQQDLADALGLSLVHTNKTLAALRKKQLVSWADGTLTVPDTQALADLAQEDIDEPLQKRPLL